MTQEDKELLLRDLSARLSYNITLNCKDEDCNFTCYLTTAIFTDIQSNNPHYEYKPYLFPLSSMTEEQKEEFDSILSSVGLCYVYDADNSIIIFSNSNYNKNNYISDFDKIEVWLNKNHFDYRNLIGKNLAIDATGKNIY